MEKATSNIDGWIEMATEKENRTGSFIHVPVG
jgi:hypothetical protein